jgi:hypothetical protein
MKQVRLLPRSKQHQGKEWSLELGEEQVQV